MKQRLSQAHLAAMNRRRRVVVNFDTNFGSPSVVIPLAGTDIEGVVQDYFSMIDEPGVEMDSIWWCWLDGNYANYPSRILPIWELPGFKKWWGAGIDPVRVFAEETRKRGKEVFFSYRLNGTDMISIEPLSKPLLKEVHPEWLIQTWESYGNLGYWNFVEQGVRDYKLCILREIAEDYDFDGIEIDFARVPVNLPPGHQWENRAHLTEFMRMVRAMTLDIEENRGRPFLIAARVPETLEGCHFDGMDVETWACEHLVDIFVLGNRSFDVDIAAFRRITARTEIKLYPCLDDHHATDGYLHPPIEVFRGVFANWWHQGADGIQTFNFAHSIPVEPDHISTLHRQTYREIGSPAGLKHRDKTFVVQRRGGGHGPTVVPNPEDWTTPRWMYYLTNMLAPLPARLANDGKSDTLLMVYIADDLAGECREVARVTVLVLLSDSSAEDLPANERLQTAIIAASKVHNLQNIPSAKGIVDQIELRLNNALLARPTVDEGWLVFTAQPDQFAVGNNLLGLCIKERSPDAWGDISIEKLEVQVKYRFDGQ